MPLSTEGRQLRAAIVQARLQAQAKKRQQAAAALASRFERAFYRRGFPALKYRGAGQQTFTSDVQNSGGTQGRLHWITIGGADEGDEKHAGGTHVLVDGSGKIQAGPGALQGKSLGGQSRTPPKKAEPQLPPEAPKREKDTIGDRNAAAGRHLDQLPPAIRDTIKNLHASRENRRTGQVTTDLLGEKLARSMYDDIKKRIGRKGDQFGHAVALENGGVGYASPAGAVQILPPAVKGQPWHVSYTSDVTPLESAGQKSAEKKSVPKQQKPPKQHGDTFDPSEFGGSGAAETSDKGRKLPSGRMGEAIQAAAQDYGIEPADLNDAADFVLEERQRLAREREAAKTHARKLTGLTAGDVSRLANSGHDYTSAAKAGGATGQKLRHFDEFSQEIAREFPELGLGDPDDPRADLAAGLWNLLAEGKQAIPSKADPEVLREAANLVMANNYSPQFSPDADYAEAFRRRGTVERYRRWQGRERLVYALAQAFSRRWPAAGRLRYDRQSSLWEEDEHPRGPDGEFVKKGAGAEGKNPVFENNEAKQANLFHGLDDLPGQQDLFPNMDKRHDEESSAATPTAAPPKPPKPSPAKPRNLFELAEENARQRSESPRPLDTAEPRFEAAKQEEENAETEYVYARESTVPNAGEDLKGSARHKANAWRGLEQAEKDGTAAQFVNRDMLLKVEPHNLISLVDEHPKHALTALAMGLALQKFPPKPSYGKRPATDAESLEKNRRDYFDAYRRLKDKAEHLARTEADPKQALTSFKLEVSQTIKELRGDSAAVKRKLDPYNEIANALVSTSNSLGVYSRKKTDVAGQLNEFGKLALEKYGQEKTPQTLDKINGHVKDVLEGKSIAKSFGSAGNSAGGAKRFDPSEAYVSYAERSGGRTLPARSSKELSKYLTDKMKMRGLQFGNSVTDDERQHHLQKATEALVDLADALGLPIEAMSDNGTLGMAFGARGHGTAAAHYEPGSKVINLTRKNGVGTLSHEWGHFFDHMLGGGKIVGGLGGRSEGDFESDKTRMKEFVYDEHGKPKLENGKMVTRDLSEIPMKKLFNNLRDAWRSSGFDKRLGETISRMVHSGQMSKGQREYWRNNPEKFARTFERYVQKKLEQGGQQNTYLTGFAGSHPLWPTDAEVEAMAPHFDAIFDQFRREKYPGRDKAQILAENAKYRASLENRWRHGADDASGRGEPERYAAGETAAIDDAGKLPKVQANYKPAFGAARCEACAHALAGGRRCELVAGPIEPADTCDLFAPTVADRTRVATEAFVRLVRA